MDRKTDDQDGQEWQCPECGGKIVSVNAAAVACENFGKGCDYKLMTG